MTWQVAWLPSASLCKIGAHTYCGSAYCYLCACTLSWPPFCSPLNCRVPGSSAYQMFPGKNIGVVAISFSRGSSPPRAWTVSSPESSALQADSLPLNHQGGLIVVILSTKHTSFPHSSVDKESACKAADPGLILGSGRSTGEGNGYPLQYSGLRLSWTV